MSKQTAINDAQIRAGSVIIERLAQNIQGQAVMLSEQFDALYPNLQFVDPAKDAAFDRYLVTLARAKSLCEVLPRLAFQAREMQKFMLPVPAADVSALNRATPNNVGLDLASSHSAAASIPA